MGEKPHATAAKASKIIAFIISNKLNQFGLESSAFSRKNSLPLYTREKKIPLT
jgi:hypothetical protein